MCPLVNALKSHKELQAIICITGQHRQMLDPVPEIFHLVSDYDLCIMKERQPLFDITVDIPLWDRSKNSGDPGRFHPWSIYPDEEFAA